jgi:hypothetical protein
LLYQLSYPGGIIVRRQMLSVLDTACPRP